jgi:hypothetical protein
MTNWDWSTVSLIERCSWQRCPQTIVSCSSSRYYYHISLPNDEEFWHEILHIIIIIMISVGWMVFICTVIHYFTTISDSCSLVFSWLLSDKAMQVRTLYQPYLDAATLYLEQLIKQVVDLQVSSAQIYVKLCHFSHTLEKIAPPPRLLNNYFSIRQLDQSRRLKTQMMHFHLKYTKRPRRRLKCLGLGGLLRRLPPKKICLWQFNLKLALKFPTRQFICMFLGYHLATIV